MGGCQAPSMMIECSWRPALVGHWVGTSPGWGFRRGGGTQVPTYLGSVIRMYGYVHQDRKRSSTPRQLSIAGRIGSLFRYFLSRLVVPPCLDIIVRFTYLHYLLTLVGFTTS